MDWGKRTTNGESRNISPTENMNFCVSSGISSFKQPMRLSNKTELIPAFGKEDDTADWLLMLESTFDRSNLKHQSGKTFEDGA